MSPEIKKNLALKEALHRTQRAERNGLRLADGVSGDRACLGLENGGESRRTELISDSLFRMSVTHPGLYCHQVYIR